MDICIAIYELQAIGGLEEYASALAVAHKQLGHQVVVVSTVWNRPDNQYAARLREHQVAILQPPKWISQLASDWPTKEHVTDGMMRLHTPLVYLLAAGLFVRRREAWAQARVSSYGWLHGQVARFVAPDRRGLLTRLLLGWLRFRNRLDVLHIQGYTSNLLFVVDWAHVHHVPVVYEEHQTPTAELDWWDDFPPTINKADRVVAVSESSAHALRTICGVTQPIFVRNPLLSDPVASGWSRAEKESNGDEPVLISTVARLFATKGLTHLLDAAVRVRSVYPYAQFRVFGDGPLGDELIAYAEQLGLDGEQIFVGAFEHRDLGTIMDHTDIFVMSSLLEGQPLAVVEAMAYGCPIVTTNVGGISELVQHGSNGLLCKPADPVCLSDNICLLLADPALRVRLGREARKSYEQASVQPIAVAKSLYAEYQAITSHPSVLTAKVAA